MLNFLRSKKPARVDRFQLDQANPLRSQKAIFADPTRQPVWTVVAFIAISLLTACGSGNSGELTGSLERPKWSQGVPLRNGIAQRRLASGGSGRARCFFE